MRWRYRLTSLGGVALLSAIAVSLANSEPVQFVVTTYIPRLNNLPATVLTGREYLIALLLTIAIVGGSLSPLYKPQVRRRLDTVVLTQKRVLIAGFLLATVGYFNWTYRLPRATLAVTTLFLLIVLPAWLLLVHDRTAEQSTRAIVVGTDTERIERIVSAAETPIVGYLSPAISKRPTDTPVMAMADGGTMQLGAKRLGGLSRLERVLHEREIDTVFLAFSEVDRGDFFGALAICHEHGVQAKALEEHRENVFFADDTNSELIEVTLEPWDWQDQLLKRLFDIAFAVVGLVVFAPVFALIAIVIKLESKGPVFYVQERTAGFGETFEVPKFRTMLLESESTDFVRDEENTRITRVGRFLRESSLDELPQLVPILTGEMSAVGPRAIWTDEENIFETEIRGWKKRWFVKPGLTGLAQIHEISSMEPRKKLEYDLKYIETQSFWLDVSIVVRQIYLVVNDVVSLLTTGPRDR